MTTLPELPDDLRWESDSTPHGPSEPQTSPDGESAEAVLEAVRQCANAWMADARIIGNVRAGDIRRAIDDIIDERDCLCERIDELTEEVADLRRRTRAGSWWQAAITIANTLRGGR